MSIKEKLILSLGFNVGWFGCVLFGQFKWGIASFIFPILFLILIKNYEQKILQKLPILLLFAAVGVLFDILMSYQGYISFLPQLPQGHIPFWLVALWLFFVVYLPVIELMFNGKWLLGGLVGALAGPFSYRAGTVFETLFIKDTFVYVIYALFWFFYFSLTLKILSKTKLT